MVIMIRTVFPQTIFSPLNIFRSKKIRSLSKRLYSGRKNYKYIWRSMYGIWLLTRPLLYISQKRTYHNLCCLTIKFDWLGTGRTLFRKEFKLGHRSGILDRFFRAKARVAMVKSCCEVISNNGSTLWHLTKCLK